MWVGGSHLACQRRDLVGLVNRKTRWWDERGSNPRRADLQSAALPTELPSRKADPVVLGEGFEPPTSRLSGERCYH